VLDNLSGPLATDSAGNLYVANNNVQVTVMRLTPDGILTTVAGGAPVSGNTLGWTGVGRYACLDDLSGDGGPATATGLCSIGALALDAAGNLFIGEEFYDDPAADNGAWPLRKVSPDGIITTAARNTHGYALGEPALLRRWRSRNQCHAIPSL
jgi:hypothetical protein